MSFASLCVFTYAYPVSFLSKNHKEVLAVRKSYRKEVLALLSCNRKEVLAVSRTQAQVICNQPQELLLADAKRSSCACIIFGLYCRLCHQSNQYLIIVDAHSRWPEVIGPMKTTTAEATANAMHNIFAKYGLPKQIVSDNGPPFQFAEYKELLHVRAKCHEACQGKCGNMELWYNTPHHTLAEFT